MSNLATNAQSNMKQVMRTALVGVSPADQLMLKGYLRLLLRLEADLEWVPANHPQVDLLFINNDFRNSPSVKKLLASTSAIPVMFVERGPDGEGHLSNDLLVLPLTELHPLNDWLKQNVAVLNSSKSQQDVRQSMDNTDKTASKESSASSAAKESVSKESASKPLFRDAVVNDKNSAEYNKKTADIAATPASNPNTKFESMISFAKQVSERPSGVYELIVADSVVGLTSLKRQRLWLNTEIGDFDGSWQLKASSQREPTTQSVDLFQWLWNKAWQAPKALVPLVSDNLKFQLRYWPKPLGKKDRSDLLRIFTALEGGARNVNEIADLADTSVNTVKKAVSGLIVSGALQPDVYKNLTSPLSAQSASDPASQKTASKPIAAKPVSTGSALDDVLARRASGQAAASVSSSIDISGNKPVAAKAEHSEVKTKKRGFLSKLRNKLGL